MNGFLLRLRRALLLAPFARKRFDRPQPSRRPEARLRLDGFEDRASPNSLADLATFSILGGVYGDDFPMPKISVEDLAGATSLEASTPDHFESQSARATYPEQEATNSS